MPAAELRAVIVDLSGTLHIGDTPIRNANEALSRLRRAALPVRACSNTTKESRASLRKRLERMGMHFAEDELSTSLAAAASLGSSHSLRPLLLLSPSAKEDFSSVPTPSSSQPANAVVVGLAPEELSYRRLNEAFRILEGNDEAQLIATHKAMYYRDDDGNLSLGPGGFVNALEEASGKKAEVVGKPSESFFGACLQSLERDGVHQEDWSKVAIVGDDVNNDLGEGAISLGLRRYLVKTGKYRKGDEAKTQGLAGVYDDFAAFVDDALQDR